MKNQNRVLSGGVFIAVVCVGLFAWRAPARPDAWPGEARTVSTPAVPATIESVESAEIELVPTTVETPAELRTLVSVCREAGRGDRGRLIELARSVDPLVAGNALRALGRLELVDVAFLDPFLADERLRVRQAAIIALAGAEEAAAAERLAGLVSAEADPTTRALAIRALGRLGGERARHKLAALGKDEGLTAVDRTFLRAALRGAPE